MIGCSGSVKDVGTMTASWVQYQAQDALVKTYEKTGVGLTLLHGRGSSIDRGDTPAHAVLLSQPPGSLKGGLRVTGRGEVIHFKYGLPEVTISSLSPYVGTVLKANLLPPPEPKDNWYRTMDELSDIPCEPCHEYVRENKDPVLYPRLTTPEQELSKLPLGSRPAERRPTSGVESLCAVPWVFTWTRSRLMLPAWLGTGAVLRKTIEDGEQSELKAMCHNWPFFSTRLGMLEIVFAKANLRLAEYCSRHLVRKDLQSLGAELRQRLVADIDVVLVIANDSHLTADLPWIAESIQLRNTYTNPPNILQAELLHHPRLAEKQDNAPNPCVEQALMTAVAGVVVDMCNTGQHPSPVAFVLLFGGDGKSRCYNHFVFNIFPLEHIHQINIKMTKHDPKIVMLQFLLVFRCYSWHYN